MAEKKSLKTPKTESKNEKLREIVIPGEVIAKGDVLPGDWTAKHGDDVIATRLGVVDKEGKLVKIVPISGVYIPRRGNVVIGVIENLTMRGWIVDIKAPYESFLMLKECPMFVNENEMADVYNVGDLVVAKISSVKREAIDLTTKGRGLGKIKEGMIIEINPYRVPRVIGKEGSMIKQIKIASGCEVTVGQNGLVWIKGNSLEDELFAKKAIEFVVDNTTTEGLTEKVEDWLKKNKKGGSTKKEDKKVEVKKEKGAEK